MKKRFAKAVALVVAAALTAGAPVSVMAAEEQSETVAVQDVSAPELPQGTDPMTLHGMQQLNDGNWYYMEHGKVSDKANGTLQPVGDEWLYVGRYRVDNSYTGLCANEAGTWYVAKGKVQFDHTGVVSQRENDRTNWYYVTDGKVDTGVNGLCYVSINGTEGWYNFKDGMVTGAYHQLVEYNGSWWYIGEDAEVDFSYTGVCQNSAGTWYVKNGQVDFGFSGVLEGKSENFHKPYKYYFVNGKTYERVHGVYYTTVNGVSGWYGFYKGELATTAPSEVANLMPNEAGWWCIDMLTGQVDFSKNGFKSVRDENGTGHLWYVRDGQVDFSLNGAYIYPDHVIPAEKYCWLVGGQIDKTCSGVYYMNLDGIEGWYGFLEGQQITYTLLPNPDDGSWWYVSTNGQIDFSRTGIVRARDHYYHLAEDAWYVRNGQVDFSYTGLVYGDEKCYLVQDGRVQKENNGLAYLTLNGETAWWQVTDGCICTGKDKKYDEETLVYYDGSWWYVKNHKVDFSYNGFVDYKDTLWYVKNGRYSYETTGFVMADGYSCYYVTNGRFDNSYEDVVYGSIDGETAWWMINNGRCAYWKMEETHTEPDSFAANTNGLWACNDGRVNFDLNGPYTSTVPYNVEKNQRVMIQYHYQMENGQVTGLQVEVV